MSGSRNTLAITLSLLGIAFLLQFQATKYYLWGTEPTGFSLGTLGLIITLSGVIVSIFNMVNEEK
ncbi:hypothetical protein GF326_13535 [Candidatus Bathyarchaeota archaeon]|nr:hypothetical protein [Candidatus Bathyarchaeota archaeon]